MIERQESYMPPKNRTEMMKKRLFERGRATPFIVNGVKKKIKKLIKGRPKRTNIP
jgi:hypothetical protein